MRERGVSELIPGRRVRDGVVPGIGLAARRQCAGMQPAWQAADPGGDACTGRVRRHAVNPPVEPQPAAGFGGQPGDETPTRAGHAGRQPDAGRFQVRGQLRIVARRFLAGVPAQLLGRETIRAQVKAPDLSHRTARYRDDRGVRYVRKPEGSADPAHRRAASVDHTLSQPARARLPPAHSAARGSIAEPADAVNGTASDIPANGHRAAGARSSGQGQKFSCHPGAIGIAHRPCWAGPLNEGKGKPYRYRAAGDAGIPRRPCPAGRFFGLA